MTLAIPVNRHDHSRGTDDPAVTVVMYGDYECHACQCANSLLNNLMHGSDLPLRLVFRHLPLSALHLHAETAALAAEAAAEQGRFWQMHDGLFGRSETLSEDAIGSLAAEVVPDLARYEHAMATQRHIRRIRGDFLGGIRSGAAGAPSMFINGHRYQGVLKRLALSDALQRAAQTAAVLC